MNIRTSRLSLILTLLLASGISTFSAEAPATSIPASSISAQTSDTIPSEFSGSSLIFWTSFGSAVGGLVGVAAIFAIQLLLEHQRSRPTVIHVYPCVTSINRGKKGEIKGSFEHHRGRVVEDQRTLQSLGVNHEVWEWTRDHTEAGNGECIFFGPYSMDAPEPGLYAAKFRICGRGFTKPQEIANNWDLIQLDVLRMRTDIVAIPKDQQVVIAPYNAHDFLGRKNIKLSELAQSGWHSYEIKFYSDGKGLLEYRAFAFDGSGLKPDFLANCGRDTRIFFDEVCVVKVNEFRLPWT